jgi:hypothetical protein
MIAIRVKSDYRFVARSLSVWGPNGEPNSPITVESEVTDLLRRLKLIRQSDSSMLAIGVESEYRSVTISLSGWILKESSMYCSSLGARTRIS